jgi:hypothetical protein
MSRNLGTLTSWNPVGLFRPVMGQLYLFVSFMCEWNNYYRHEDRGMVSDRLKIKQNNVLSITWEGGTKKQVITHLLKSNLAMYSCAP